MSFKKYASRLSAAMGALWLCLFPLWQRGTYSHITLDKYEGMKYLTGATLLLAATLLVLWVTGCARAKRERPEAPRARLTVLWCQMPAMLLFGWMALSALFFGAWRTQLNADGGLCVWLGARRWEGMLTQLCYFAVFLCMTLRPVPLRFLANAAAAVMLVFAAVVALQYADLNPLGLFPGDLSTRTNYEFQGTIGNIDMVSGYTVLVTALLAGTFCGTEKGSRLCLAGTLAGVLLECCMGVQSGLIATALCMALLTPVMLTKPETRRRGWLLIAGALACAALRTALDFPWPAVRADKPENLRLVFGWKTAALLSGALLAGGMAYLRRRRPGRALTRRQTLALAAAVLIAGTALLALGPIPPSAGGLWELHEVLNGRAQDSFGSWRLGVWRESLEMAKENLLFGNGPGTFWYAFRPRWLAYEASLKAAGTLAASRSLERFDAPHNEYVAYLCNAGLPALLFFLALLGAVLFFGIRAAARDPKKLGLPLAVACFAAQAFFSFSICLVSPMFWAVLGMCAAAGTGGLPAPAEPEKAPAGPAAQRSSRPAGRRR